MCKECKKSRGRGAVRLYTLVETEDVYWETQKKLVRPQINVWCLLGILAAYFAALGLLTWGALWGASHFSWYASVEKTYAIRFALTYLGLLVLTAILFARHILTFIIRLYQRFVPAGIRCACLYTPNCSEYMILAMKKYGFIRGVTKGIVRLLSCKYPNGGEDYP